MIEWTNIRDCEARVESCQGLTHAGLGAPGATEWDGMLKPVRLEIPAPESAVGIEVVSDGRMELDELVLLSAGHVDAAVGGMTAPQRSSLREKVRDPHLRRRWERKAAACSRCLEEVRHQPAGGRDGRLRRASDHAVVGEHDQVDVGVVEVRAQSSLISLARSTRSSRSCSACRRGSSASTIVG